MGCLNAHISRVGNGLQGKISRVGNGLQVRFGVVCSVNKAKHLRVEPEYIFLMKGNNFMDEVVVWSNVEWEVG